MYGKNNLSAGDTLSDRDSHWLGIQTTIRYDTKYGGFDSSIPITKTFWYTHKPYTHVIVTPDATK